MSTAPPNPANTYTPPPPSVRLAIISGNDNGWPDQKTLYTKVAQSRPTITDTIPIPHHPPLTYRSANRPPPDRLSDDLSGTLKYPDEFIPNTKPFQNSSTSPDTPLSRLSDVHDTS